MFIVFPPDDRLHPFRVDGVGAASPDYFGTKDIP
jgi:hypothetical protein